MIRIISSRFDDGDDGVRPHKSRDVVDVAMRVVARRCRVRAKQRG